MTEPRALSPPMVAHRVTSSMGWGSRDAPWTGRCDWRRKASGERWNLARKRASSETGRMATDEA